MAIMVTAFAFGGCSGGDTNDELKQRRDDIVGGAIVGPDVEPAVVYWQDNSRACTGTFVTDRHLLTAAHCVTSPNMPAGQGVYFTRATSRTEGGTWANASAVHVDPGYAFPAHDVAVIEFPAPVAGHVRPLARQFLQATLQPGTQVQALGYGCQTAWRSPDSGIRKTAFTTLAAEVGEYIVVNGDYALCPGDSGGPVFSGGEIIGIASYGSFNLSYSGYASLRGSYPWLQSLGLTAPPSGEPAHVAVERGFFPGVGHWFGTPLPEGFQQEQVVYLRAEPTADSNTIYGCAHRGHNFPSFDPNCEGQPVLGLIGYTSASQLPGTSALYRCNVNGTGVDHFVSPDPGCEGHLNEGLLGFTFPN